VRIIISNQTERTKGGGCYAKSEWGKAKRRDLALEKRLAPDGTIRLKRSKGLAFGKHMLLDMRSVGGKSNTRDRWANKNGISSTAFVVYALGGEWKRENTHFGKNTRKSDLACIRDLKLG